MAHREFTLSNIPVYCQSPTAGPPEHKALLIGINYASPAGDNEQLEAYRELKGPVNDAKEMKRALIGAVSARAPFGSWLGINANVPQSCLITKKRTYV